MKIDYVNLETTGNAIDFGNLLAASSYEGGGLQQVEQVDYLQVELVHQIQIPLSLSLLHPLATEQILEIYTLAQVAHVSDTL